MRQVNYLEPGTVDFTILKVELTQKEDINTLKLLLQLRKGDETTLTNVWFNILACTKGIRYYFYSSLGFDEEPNPKEYKGKSGKCEIIESSYVSKKTGLRVQTNKIIRYVKKEVENGW